MLFWLSLLLALGFTVIHFSSKYMVFLTYIPRSKLLSLAGGISVAYVFIHVLPELNEHQQTFSDMKEDSYLRLFDHHVYLFSMVGLALYYGLERMVKTSKSAGGIKKQAGEVTTGVFWIHMFAFAVYNAVIGYLLLRKEEQDLTGMLLYFFALSVHFISNDHSLRESHEETYDKYGRWLLSFSVLIGWGAALIIQLDDKIIAVLFAFLAGSIVLNVLKEELPEERESNFWTFLGGLIFYSFLLLLM